MPDDQSLLLENPVGGVDDRRADLEPLAELAPRQQLHPRTQSAGADVRLESVHHPLRMRRLVDDRDQFQFLSFDFRLMCLDKPKL